VFWQSRVERSLCKSTEKRTLIWRRKRFLNRK
jgi:hypothetical protein